MADRRCWATVKAAMGEKLGADFSSVRFHTEAAAAARADAMGARAYTSGSDVFFGSGGFDPAVAAREPVHTVQQGAVAGSIPTISAPAGGVQMWPGSKKKPQAREMKLPENVFFADRETLKANTGPGGKVDNRYASVVKVNGTDDDQTPAVLKMDADPVMEYMLTQYYNAAGETYSDEHGSLYNFDAPDARPLNANELKEVEPLVKDERLRSTSGGQSTKKEMERMAIFAMAGGKSRKSFDKSKRLKAMRAINPKYSLNPKDPKENADYQRTMGYVTMPDMVTGNTDRLLTQPNIGNWTEDREARQIHLIDNDYHAFSAIRHGEKGRQSWLGQFFERTGSSGDLAATSKSLLNSTGGWGRDADTMDVLGNRSENARTGIAQAAADLPLLRKKLKDQFKKENNVARKEELPAEQQELLERMNISNEVMTDPAMAKIYTSLRKLGLKGEEGEDAKKTQERTELLAQRDALRRARKAPRGGAAAGTAAPAAAPVEATTPAEAPAPVEAPPAAPLPADPAMAELPLLPDEPGTSASHRRKYSQKKRKAQ